MKITEQSKNKNRDFSTPNYMVLLFVISYLLIEFLPSFETIERYSPQYLYLAILNIIITVYCYCKPEMLHQNLITVFRKSVILKVYASFLFFCGISIITAGNVSLALISFSKLLIVFCMFINITVLLYKRLSLLYQVAFIVGVSVIVQSFFILFDFSKTLDLGTIKGNYGNINILAASLNIKIPFLVLGIIHFPNWKRGILAGALLLGTTLIFLTGSRATFLGLAIQLLFFLVFYAKIYTIKKADFIKIACILVPVLISFFTANLIFEKVGNSDRYKSVGNRIGQIGDEDASAKIRLDFWKNASEISTENLQLGVGIGNWKIESLPYENTLINDSDISSNTHNDFLEITAETGILNGLLYLSLFILIFYISIKKILKTNDKETQLVALLSLMLLLGYGIDAFFNFPLYIPSMQLGFCFLLATIVLNSTTTDDTKLHYPYKKMMLGLIGIGCVLLYFAYSQFKAAQLEYKFKIYQATYRVNNSLPETGRLLESNDIIANLPKFPSVSYYSEPFVEYAGVSLFYEGKYDEAMPYFVKAKKINPYLGNSDWYIHKIEFNKGNIDSAYKYAKIAFDKRPRNRDFYLSALYMANEKKDTLGMLKIHNQFSKYRKMPENWVNTSKALQLSGYSSKKLLSFLDQGLAAFPKDSLLLERKSSVINVSRNDYLLKAQQYGATQEFDKAILYYQKALKEDPENALVKQNIGICYFKLNKYNSAISYLLKVINDPKLDNDGKTEYVLGACYISINNKEKGCKYLHLSKTKNFLAAEELMQKFCE